MPVSNRDSGVSKKSGDIKDNPVNTNGSEAVTLHDLNNMFASVIGGLQLLGIRYRDDLKAQEIVSSSLTSVNNIRDYLATAYRTRRGTPPETDFAPKGHRSDRGHAMITDSADRHDLFFAAIEMTRMPMIVTDPNKPDNPVVFANQAFLNTTGYEMDEVVGRNCRFLQGPGTDREAIANIRRAIADRTDIAVEIQNYRKDGTMFWNALFVSPIFDRNGKLLYYFGSQLDITRRREAETALRRAQKMEAIGQLTGGIAHDFNNLLQVIIGNLQMARTVVDKPHRIGRYHDAVMSAAQKARTLTQQLLAFSRQQPLEARVVNLNRVITELRDLLSKTLGAHIEIELELAPDLANAQIDIVQLEMALINILANARDAMPNGGKVTIATGNVTVVQGGVNARSGRYVELSVRDNGEGMTQDVLAHITEPFFTTKEVGKGTGLGLAQVYGFVKQSEGGFGVDSEVGKGTTIRMTFPASDGAADGPVERPREDQVRGQGKGERVLVVEDNREVRELASAVLEQEGYTVVEASNASEALQVLDGHPDRFDMLFTDIIMPGHMNGVALAKEIKQKVPDIAVLITTGFADDVHGHTNSAAFETIYKPYMPDELARKIRSVLNRKLDHSN
jgi:PAS domain S-box-containing protein